MILLAIKVVLLFTYTSSDLYSLLFYNLINFVCWTVYKNDTPERIMQFTGKITGLSHTSSGNHPWAINASYVVLDTGVCNGGTAYSAAALEYGERPVLYLNKLLSNTCLYLNDTEGIQS